MSDELVTVASFPDAFAANVGRNQLIDEGLRACLADEEAVTMAPHLVGAFGGVKLLVPESETERAAEILADETLANTPEMEQAWRVPSEDDEAGLTPAQVEAAAEEIPLSPRELMAVRVVRGAIVGLLFWPLELFVLWLLLDVMKSSERLRAKYYAYSIVATVIAIPLGFFAGLLICGLILLFVGGGIHYLLTM